MDGLTLLRDARRAGLDVAEDRDRLVVRGPRRLEPTAMQLLAHRDEVLRALAIERSEVEWRVATMREQVPPTGAIPFLLARPAAVRGAGRCCSCGDPLGPDDRYRCQTCVEAAVRVLEALP